MKPLPAKGERLPDLIIAAITKAQVEAYLAVSGDDNPIVNAGAKMHRLAGVKVRHG
jgi:hypothetical protein